MENLIREDDDGAPKNCHNFVWGNYCVCWIILNWTGCALQVMISLTSERQRFVLVSPIFYTVFCEYVIHGNDVIWFVSQIGAVVVRQI